MWSNREKPELLMLSMSPTLFLLQFAASQLLMVLPTQMVLHSSPPHLLRACLGAHHSMLGSPLHLHALVCIASSLAWPPKLASFLPPPWPHYNPLSREQPGTISMSLEHPLPSLNAGTFLGIQEGETPRLLTVVYERSLIIDFSHLI